MLRSAGPSQTLWCRTGRRSPRCRPLPSSRPCAGLMAGPATKQHQPSQLQFSEHDRRRPKKHPPPSLSALHSRLSAKEDTGEDTELGRQFNTCILQGHVIYLLGNCSSRHHEAWAPTNPSSGAE